MDKDYVSKLSESVGGSLSDVRKSIVLTVEPASISNACALIKQSPSLYHLSALTGVDEGQTISVYYHFWEDTSFLTIKTHVPKADPRLQSVADILPSAVLYEAEVKDLLGVIFEGNPFMKGKLLLPENYPSEAPPPLRKEADPAKIRKMMGLE